MRMKREREVRDEAEEKKKRERERDGVMDAVMDVWSGIIWCN